MSKTDIPTTPTGPQEKELTTAPSKTLSHSERFANKVMSEFGTNVAGVLEVSEYQKSLIQGYFIAIDRALEVQEENRIRKNENNKNHDYDNLVPYTWENVNLKDLALDVVHFSKMGLDAMEKNHISVVPYLNRKTNKYDVNLMRGYAGIEYTAKKYALDPPKSVTVELVYSTDYFKSIKKDITHSIEGYEFSIKNPFDRGEVIGGFGYIEYDDPKNNKLITMSVKDIEKRKPPYASAEFWGGKKKEWQNGKQVEVETDGWYDEMCLKTVKREVYSEKNILRDPRKVDDDYNYILQREANMIEVEAQNEIHENANVTPIELPESTSPETTQSEAPAAPADDLP